MYKKTIKYVDFNGIEKEEDYYFNLTRSEISMMQLTTVGGFKEQIEKIVKSKDIKMIVETFKTIILTAYGVKSEDGLHFYKDDAIRKEFEASAAYDELFMELSTNEKSAVEFINGIVPVLPEDHKKASDTPVIEASFNGNN